MYEAAAALVIACMGFIIHTTLKLNAYRRSLGVPRRLLNFRDMQVIIEPRKFDRKEILLVRVNWLASAVLLGLVIGLFWLLPPEVVEQLEQTAAERWEQRQSRLRP